MTLDHAIKVRILASQPTPLLPFVPRIDRLPIGPDALIVFSPKPYFYGAFSLFGHATDIWRANKEESGVILRAIGDRLNVSVLY